MISIPKYFFPFIKGSVLSNTTLSTIGKFYFTIVDRVVLENTALSTIVKKILLFTGWYFPIPPCRQQGFFFLISRSSGIFQYHPVDDRDFFFLSPGDLGIGKYLAHHILAFLFFPNYNDFWNCTYSLQLYLLDKYLLGLTPLWSPWPPPYPET